MCVKPFFNIITYDSLWIHIPWQIKCGTMWGSGKSPTSLKHHHSNHWWPAVLMSHQTALTPPPTYYQHEHSYPWHPRRLIKVHVVAVLPLPRNYSLPVLQEDVNRPTPTRNLEGRFPSSLSALCVVRVHGRFNQHVAACSKSSSIVSA